MISWSYKKKQKQYDQTIDFIYFQIQTFPLKWQKNPQSITLNY